MSKEIDTEYQTEYQWFVLKDKLQRKCDKCKQRFKCFTTNTSNRPQQLKGINFEVAKCCARCKNSSFKTGKSPKQNITYRTHNYYLRVGKCALHSVSVHQFSACGDFIPKLQDTLTFEVNTQIQKELEYVTNNYKFPRYCIIDNKHIGVPPNASNKSTPPNSGRSKPRTNNEEA